MAIVQISRITNRKGLTENLPQLAGAELGWCVDSRRLFIGNGTLQEGAPFIGNTEILTQFSDIVSTSPYTYSDVAVGYAAQTGPTPSDPVVRTVQAKLDDFASVRDFGAVGDGVADDTAAINRALYQLYCREVNTQIRRSLFFPAGTYRVTDTVLIPSFAKLMGEGADCSIIRFAYPDWSGASSWAAGSTVTAPDGNIYRALVRVPELNQQASFISSITGTNLTLQGDAIGYVYPGQLVTGDGVIPGTRLVSGSGANWVVDISQTVTTIPMTFINDSIIPLSNTDYWDPVSISSLPGYVAQTADSLQQTGVNIGNNGAAEPQNIEISSLTFQTAIKNDVFLVQDAAQCYFDSVNFRGPLTKPSITSDLGTDNIAGVRFSSTSNFICNQITFDKCRFAGLTYGVNTLDQTQSVTISNSDFEVLFQGVVLGDGVVVNGGPAGTRIVSNRFDLIYAEGIVFGNITLNVSAHNIFFDVGNDLKGVGNPAVPVISIGYDNNVSAYDMFERTNDDNNIKPRIFIAGSTTTVGSSTTSQIQLGRYVRTSGATFAMTAQGSPQSIVTVNSADVRAFRMDYTIIGSGTGTIRTGTLTVVVGPSDDSSQDAAYTDDYTENFDADIVLGISKSSDNITVNYTSTGAATLTYSLEHLA